MSDTNVSTQNSHLTADGQRKYRSRHMGFVMDAFDEIVFTYALRDAFSKLDIIDTSWTAELRDSPRFCETLAHGGYLNKLRLPCNEAGTEGDVPEPQDRQSKQEMCSFRHFRSRWSFGGRVTSRWPFEFPYLESGEIDILWYLDEPLVLPTVRKVSHLLTRVTTNRAKHLYPGWEGHDIKVFRYRFGHHALLWCSRNPGSIIGDRFRPADDWSVPKSKWYRDLWQRVVRDYGEDFADPHLRGPLVQFVGPRPRETEV